MILANPAGMLLAGRDRKSVADQSHLNRAECARDVPQSERPVGTLSPTPQRAGLTDGTGMLNARVDRAPIRGRAYPQRGGLTQRRAKPQFFLSIGPPAPQFMLGVDATRVVSSARNLRKIG